MPGLKKWEIPHLEGERRFRAAARRILAWRLHDVLRLVHAFLHTREAEPLHQLRIAIRRLRYPLETLLSQVRRRTVLSFIEDLNAMQDAAGTARDLDVLIQRLREDEARYGWGLRRMVYIDLEEKRRILYREAEDGIALFLVSPMLYDFKRAIRYDEFADELQAASDDNPDLHPITETASEEDRHDRNEEDPRPD